MISSYHGDIVSLEVDALVNAADCELEHRGGVALAIARAAGEELVKESDERGYVPIGSFAATTAGNLHAKEVLHVPTIDWAADRRIALPELQSAWRDVLDYCRGKGFASVAVPLLGAGVAGLDAVAVRAMIESVAEEFDDLAVTIVQN